MRKIFMLITLGSLLFTLNCATVAYGPIGGVFTSAKIGSYGTGKTGNKKGEACTTSILGIVAFGDASIDAAKGQANINEITAVNHDIFQILGLYAKMCTIVQGN